MISIKHAHLGRAPLYTFGDGLRRVFTLATTIPRVRDGFLLIDELETAIHAKALEKTFAWLVKACIDNNVQLFATTHSLEALDIVTEVSLDSVLTECASIVYPEQKKAAEAFINSFEDIQTLHFHPFDKEKALVASIVSILKPGMSNTPSIAQDEWISNQAIGTVNEIMLLHKFIKDLLNLSE